jgi:ubiquinone biosynthesis protein UbiJ
MPALSLQLALATAESALNAALALDATAPARLAAFDGKVIALRTPEGSSPALSLYLLPGRQGLTLAGQWEAEADCCLSAPASRLLELALSRNKSAVLHAADLKLSGDSSLLLKLAGVLDALELDFEGALAERFGPLGAVALALPLRQSLGWARDSAPRLSRDIADWLTEEARHLVGRAEAEARFAELDHLKLTLDRLEARCARLDARLDRE